MLDHLKASSKQKTPNHDKNLPIRTDFLHIVQVVASEKKIRMHSG